MLRPRIAATVCSVTFALLGLVVDAGVATATAPTAASPAPSGVASGDPGYPAQSPLLTVSSGSVSVGGSVLVTGRGFQSGEGVDISVTYSPANHALGSSGPVAQPAALTLRHSAGRPVSAVHALATSDGEFSTHVSLTQQGNATITATGEQSHLSVAATVSVLPATSVGAASKSTKRALPFSNMKLQILVLVIVALLVGAGIRWQRRSRKASAVPDTPAVPDVAAAHNVSPA
jgi:hypothetical protein